jgi:hypothetical protein
MVIQGPLSAVYGGPAFAENVDALPQDHQHPAVGDWYSERETVKISILRLRPKLHSISPLSVATPATWRPRCRSSAGVHGTRAKPRPLSIMANRPGALSDPGRLTPSRPRSHFRGDAHSMASRKRRRLMVGVRLTVESSRSPAPALTGSGPAFGRTRNDENAQDRYDCAYRKHHRCLPPKSTNPGARHGRKS